MSRQHDPSTPSLLEELDAKQNEVLDQLEALNGRIEAVIHEWSQEGRAAAA